MILSRLALIATLLPAAIPATSWAQSSPASAPVWALETVVTAMGVPGEGSANITIDGTAPVFGLRLSHAVGHRWSISVNAGSGEAAKARRDVYERPSGPTRIDTYDYGALFVGAGAEHTWPIGRLGIVTGADLGWFKERWRVASHVDPAGLEPPQSSFDGNVAAAARLGVRHAFTQRVAVLAQLRYFGGAHVSAVAPEVGLRWAF